MELKRAKITGWLRIAGAETGERVVTCG